MTTPALSVRHANMTFPGTRALRDVDLDVAPGEVHAVVGHNGSGKSTLVKILAGQYLADPGTEVRIAGQPLAFESPAESDRLGLRVVHQNLGLVLSLSVTENVAMGTGGYRARALQPIKWRAEHKRVAEEMERLGYPLDPRRAVGELPVSARSAVAIARALVSRDDRAEPRVVLLDEVTATMPDLEISRLLTLVRSLKERGVAVLYISHHLEEVVDVADQVTVLRDGQRVVSRPKGNLTHQELADLLVGGTEWRDPTERPALTATETEIAALRLDVSGLHGSIVRDVSFGAGPGRIVGFAGITGSGREEIVKMLHGALPREGSVQLGGKIVPPDNPRRSVAMGITYVPPDRLSSAVVATQNVEENLTMSTIHRRPALSLVRARSERRGVQRWLNRLEIRGATPEGPITTLSGGNQQKVIIARCLAVKPNVLLLDEPTQGVDIGAVTDIHGLIREAAATSTVIVSSSDSYELASLCTEVIVLHRGKIVGHLHGADVTEENLDRMQLSPPSAPSTTRSFTLDKEAI